MKKFDLFVWVVGLLIGYNLMVTNDAISLWSGAEAALVWDQPWASPLMLRIAAAIFLLLGALLFVRLAGPLLGARTSLLAVLVAGSSLFVPLLSHSGTVDGPVLVLHSLGLMSLLRYIRQPGWRWQLASISALLISVILAPLSSTLLFAIYPLMLWRLADWRAAIRRINPWVMALAALGFSYFVYGGRIAPAAFQVSAYSWWFFVGPLLGFLPYLGFLMAGLRDYSAKMIRGDEFSLVLLGWLVAALLAGSPAWSMALAVLVARQLDAYFVPGYPYGNYVKTGALIHLVAAFFLCTGLMMSGLHYFGGAGFRAGLGMSAAYWSLSFIGVIGLFGIRRRYILGGPMLAGTLLISLWWTQFFPLIERERRANLSVLEHVNQSEISIIYDPKSGFPAVAVYARDRFPEAKIQVMQRAAQVPLSGNVLVTAPGQDSLSGWRILSRPDSLKLLHPFTLMAPEQR
jgi:hypothetical protein